MASDIERLEKIAPDYTENIKELAVQITLAMGKLNLRMLQNPVTGETKLDPESMVSTLIHQQRRIIDLTWKVEILMAFLEEITLTDITPITRDLVNKRLKLKWDEIRSDIDKAKAAAAKPNIIVTQGNIPPGLNGRSKG